MPSWVMSTTLSLPLVSSASISSSPSSMVMAMMPPLRTLSKSERFVFLTMPVRVAKRTCSVGSHVWSTGPSSVLTILRCTRMVAAIFSSGRSSRKLTMERPLDVRLPSGNS